MTMQPLGVNSGKLTLAGQAQVIVYQPGGTAGGNVYTGIAPLTAALANIQGPVTLAIDTTYGAATLPAGATNLGANTRIASGNLAGAPATLSSGSTSTLTHALTGISNVVLQSNNPAGLMQLAAGNYALWVDHNAVLSGVGGPVLQGVSGAVLNVLLDSGSEIVNNGAIAVNGFDTTNITAGNGAIVGSSAITSTIANTGAITSPSASISTNQTPALSTSYTGNQALTNPTVYGTCTNSPVSPSPITAAEVFTKPYTAQTVSSAAPVVIATIPLPGTTGSLGPLTSVPAKGQLDLDYDVSVTGATTAVGARWKGYVSYTVQTSGSPVLLDNEQPLAYGTNSKAVPAGWTLTATLDGTSKNILLTLTTDATSTYDCHADTQQKYTQ
jgi:hypothetical protein